MRHKALGASIALALSMLAVPVATSSAATLAPATAVTPSDCDSFETIAHRGVWGKGTGNDENSIAAFDAAAERGYSIEVDVWVDAEGQTWVFHDRDTSRATGVAGLITDMTTEEVRSLRYLKNGSALVTLDEAMTAFADYPATRVYLEPKFRSLADDAAQAIVDSGRVATSYLTNHRDQVATTFPEVMVLQKVDGDLPRRPRQFVRQGVEIVAGPAGRLQQQTVARYQRQGIEVQGRNANVTGAWRRTIQSGADGQLTTLSRELEAFCPVALKRPVIKRAGRLDRRTLAIRGRFFTDALEVRVAGRGVRFDVVAPRRIDADFKNRKVRRATIYVRNPNGSVQRTIRLG